MALFFNILITVYLISISYLNIFIGLSPIPAYLFFFILIYYVIHSLKKNENNHAVIMIIFLFIFLWIISLFPPLYDDEFGYVTGLIQQYCKNNIIKATESIGLFSYLYSGYESGIANFYCINDLYTLRFLNIIILIGIFSIFYNYYEEKKYTLILFTIPVIVSNGLILKNDILAGYLILSIYYFFYKNNLLNVGLSFSVLTILKPIFIFDALLILLIFLIYDYKKLLLSIPFISIMSLLSIFPWMYLNFFQFGQPFFPIIILPFLEFKSTFFNISDFEIYKKLTLEHYYGLNNFSIINGNILIFFKNICMKFGIIYILIYIHSLRNFKSEYGYKIITISLPFILFLSLWEPRYHIGFVLIAYLYFEKCIKKY